MNADGTPDIALGAANFSSTAIGQASVIFRGTAMAGATVPPGASALKARKRGRPKSFRLAPHQAALTVRSIKDKCPDRLSMPYALWTRSAVGEFIRRKFGVAVAVWTVGRCLKRWGFTPQKPLNRATE